MDDGYVRRTAGALKAALRIADMDASALAERIGYSPETVRRWTRGETEMRASAIAAVADVLDVPADLFVRPPESPDEVVFLVAAWRGARRGLRERA